MKKKRIFLAVTVLSITLFTTPGCVTTAYDMGYSLGYRTRMKELIAGIYDQKIPLADNPFLPWPEQSLLNSVSTLRILINKFSDSRAGAAGKIPKFREPIDTLITKAVGNELERNHHVVIKEPVEKDYCDFMISGKIEDFSSYPFEIVVDNKFKEEHKNYNWVTQVIFEIEVQGIKNCTLSGKRKYSIVWLTKWTGPQGRDAVPSFEQVGRSLDETLLKAIRGFSNDEELVKILTCRSK